MDTPKFSGFGQQSIYQVARELKKEQHTLYNCLASILSDAAFIQEIKLLYPDLPLLANLRAGGWYTPSPQGTCYFKSTDGHQNNCNFSTTRLNWHVAELAAQKGGVMVVDATRKGKRFPVSPCAAGTQAVVGVAAAVAAAAAWSKLKAMHAAGSPFLELRNPC
jgi:tRNA A64-2'-O-ribosylphosphate transferase